MSIANLRREPMDGIPTGRYCDGWREVWRATDPNEPQGDGSYVWERAMPRLTDDILEISIYLYETHIDADRGEKAGGSGFLYEIPFDPEATMGKGHLYAVSNWHVVKKAPVIRLNSSEGPKIIRKKTTDWIRHQDEQTDIAVCPLADDLRTDDRSLHTLKSVSPAHLATKDRIAELNIGIGDNTFLVGRFINHDGVQKNDPSVRFGAIAQMPKNKIETETGEQEAFLVEVKSIAGYSGSPVFALISERRSLEYKQKIESMRPNPTAMLLVQAQEATELFILLGIDCGHLIDQQPVYNADRKKSGQYIESNTGMSVVIVPWKLIELLEVPLLKNKREEARRQRQSEIVAAEDFAEQPRKATQLTTPKEGNPVEIPIPTERQFTSDLGKLLRRKPSQS
jgi:hypothetical protein